MISDVFVFCFFFNTSFLYCLAISDRDVLHLSSEVR